MSETPPPPRRTIVRPGPEEVTAACADLFRSLAVEAVGRHGTFTVALAGGTTPHALYARLARQAMTGQLPWGQMTVFFGDERDVPHDHVESNYHMAQRTLLDNVPIPLDQVFPMPADAEIEALDQAAADYEQTIRRTLDAGADGVPKFDLILLGMGGDGHTASLFPGTDALDERTKLVAAHFVPVLGRHRMTFTYPLINAAHTVLMIVTGDDKIDAVDALVNQEPDCRDIPAAGVQPTDGQLICVFDVAAARKTDLRPE